MLKQFTIQTGAEGMYDITETVEDFVRETGIKEGICLVYCPHTTAAITINENADPAVSRDMMLGLNNVFPADPAYQHFEGNSPAHLKSSAVGDSELLIIENGKLVRGLWQGVYFMEFDGPRKRSYYVKVLRG